MDVITKLKRDIVLTAYNAQEGHIPSALSCVKIIWELFDVGMGYNDMFILSKGHGCLALYVVLAEKNIIPKEYLDDFCKFNSELGGHPDSNKIPCVVASTGSLGHGLPIGVGMALAKKIKGESGRIYVLMGDGECNEGTTWESALLIRQLGLDNITCYVDSNNSSAINLSRLQTMFEYISDCFYVLKTTKGDGVSMMEDNPEKWHHGTPNKEELDNILNELK